MGINLARAPTVAPAEPLTDGWILASELEPSELLDLSKKHRPATEAVRKLVEPGARFAPPEHASLDGPQPPDSRDGRAELRPVGQRDDLADATGRAPELPRDLCR